MTYPSLPKQWWIVSKMGRNRFNVGCNIAGGSRANTNLSFGAESYVTINLEQFLHSCHKFFLTSIVDPDLHHWYIPTWVWLVSSKKPLCSAFYSFLVKHQLWYVSFAGIFVQRHSGYLMLEMPHMHQDQEHPN